MFALPKNRLTAAPGFAVSATVLKPAKAPMVSKWAVNGDTAPLGSRLSVSVPAPLSRSGGFSVAWVALTVLGPPRRNTLSRPEPSVTIPPAVGVPTATVAVSVAAENAVTPIEAGFPTPPLLPADWSQASKVSEADPGELALGAKKTRVEESAASSRTLAMLTLGNTFHVAPLLVE